MWMSYKVLNFYFTYILSKAGADPGFPVGGALKKIVPSGGRCENFWGISCEKSRFYSKKSYFFPILGDPPPWIRPCKGIVPRWKIKISLTLSCSVILKSWIKSMLWVFVMLLFLVYTSNYDIIKRIMWQYSWNTARVGIKHQLISQSNKRIIGSYTSPNWRSEILSTSVRNSIFSPEWITVERG